MNSTHVIRLVIETSEGFTTELSLPGEGGFEYLLTVMGLAMSALGISLEAPDSEAQPVH